MVTIAQYQIGYQSSLGTPFNPSQSRFSDISDFTNIDKFSGFDIRLLNKGQSANSVWAIEAGINDGQAYLVNTPPIRIKSFTLDYERQLEVNDKFLRLFDYDKRLILGADIYSDQIWVDLNSLLIFNPNDVENKKVYWEILYQMPNDGTSTVVVIENDHILGTATGRAYIRVTTDDGAKSIDLEVYVLGNVTDVFLLNKEDGSHENQDDLVSDVIILENYTSIKLFTEILPQSAKDSGIIWSSSNESIASVDRNGNIYIHYRGSADNPVVNKNYTKEVSVVIRASSIDNILVYDEVTIIITPSNNTSLESGLKVYERGINIPLSKVGNSFRFTDPHRLVRYDVEYLNLEFYTNYNQTYKIRSSHATIDNSLVDGKNVYISKGDLVGNSYENRINTIEIIIISESGLEEIYTLEVTKALSANKQIGTLNASYDQENMLNYTFQNDRFVITSRIPYGTTRLYFSPILANNNSIYTKSNFHKITFSLYNTTEEYDGYIDLPTQSGKILVLMKVVAEDKTTKVYEIEVVIGYSNLDSLDNIFIGHSTQNNLLNFDPNTHEYNIELPLRFLNNLLISTTPTLDESGRQVSRVYIAVDSSRPVETNGILIDIMSGRTVVIQIRVQSEANYNLDINEYNVYTIYLHSEASNEAKLFEIELNNNYLDVLDEIDNYTYTFYKGKETDELTNLRMKLVSSPWSVQEVIYESYQNNFNGAITSYNLRLHQSLGYYQIPFIQSGTYKFKITIIAQNNIDSHVYYLEVTKESSQNAKIDYIDLLYQNKSILEEFLIPDNHEQFSYDVESNVYTMLTPITIPYAYDYLDVFIEIHRYARYRTNQDLRYYSSYEKARINLTTSINKITLEVFSKMALIKLFMNYKLFVNIIRIHHIKKSIICKTLVVHMFYMTLVIKQELLMMK